MPVCVKVLCMCIQQGLPIGLLDYLIDTAGVCSFGYNGSSSLDKDIRFHDLDNESLCICVNDGVGLCDMWMGNPMDTTLGACVCV